MSTRSTIVLTDHLDRQCKIVMATRWWKVNHCTCHLHRSNSLHRASFFSFRGTIAHRSVFPGKCSEHSLIWISALIQTVSFSECGREYILDPPRKTFEVGCHQIMAMYRCSTPYCVPSNHPF
jgi:hypothetical protein